MPAVRGIFVGVFPWFRLALLHAPLSALRAVPFHTDADERWPRPALPRDSELLRSGSPLPNVPRWPSIPEAAPRSPANGFQTGWFPLLQSSSSLNYALAAPFHLPAIAPAPRKIRCTTLPRTAAPLAPCSSPLPLVAAGRPSDSERVPATSAEFRRGGGSLPRDRMPFRQCGRAPPAATLRAQRTQTSRESWARRANSAAPSPHPHACATATAPCRRIPCAWF